MKLGQHKGIEKSGTHQYIKGESHSFMIEIYQLQIPGRRDESRTCLSDSFESAL